MNKFYKKGLEINALQLAVLANDALEKKVLTEWDFDSSNPKSRVHGHGHCDCLNEGIFEFIEEIDGKVYFKCKKCGGYTHL